MCRKLLVVLAIVLAVVAAKSAAVTSSLASGGEFAGPGPGITGNDTGGIFPYSPAVDGIYQQIAEGHCARYGRLAKVTSIHRQYGDYVSFVCYDRPGMIH
jgi:hypothetical protein